MLPDRYNKKNISKALSNPSIIVKEIRNFSHKVLSKPGYRLQKKYFLNKYGSGINVMDEDWDNLILLDACRFDVFKQRNIIEGNLNYVISQGSASWEFMEKNYVKTGPHHDTVYVSANPHIERLKKENKNLFYDIIHLDEEWDSEVGTIYPESVVEATIEAHRKYPNKRIISHFMQPHTPYIGKKAKKIREDVDIQEFYHTYDGTGKNSNNWDRKKSGVKTKIAVKRTDFDMSGDDMWDCYIETLDITLGEVSRLIEKIDGKSVVSADHGEMIGETVFPFTKKIYAHPSNVYISQLRKVPWLVIDADERRQIRTDDPIETKTMDEKKVEKRLSALGYK